MCLVHAANVANKKNSMEETVDEQVQESAAEPTRKEKLQLALAKMAQLIGIGVDDSLDPEMVEEFKDISVAMQVMLKNDMPPQWCRYQYECVTRSTVAFLKGEWQVAEFWIVDAMLRLEDVR